MAGLGIELTTELRQTMKLTPAQLQTVEILQMNAIQLEERVNSELMENPVLEVAEAGADDPAQAQDKTVIDVPGKTTERDLSDETPAFDRYDDHDYWETRGHSWGQGRSADVSGGIADFEKYYQAENTLVDHLMHQLHATKCPDGVRRACRFVIYSLDKNGFLDMGSEELEEASENTAEEFRQAIPIVQSMDPAGIAARNLEECLCLQLDPEDELAEDARVIINRLRDISSGKIKAVIRETGITQERLMRILELIKSLDPRPGARFSDGSSQKHITPDVIAEVSGGHASIYMAGSQPHLGLSRYYVELAESTTDEEVRKYLKERIDRAAGLIKNIEQRSNTIISVTRVILEHQNQFLQPGDHTLRPLSMQEVADELEIHVSTVSRAVSGKYLKCPGGTYALRYFFTAEVAGGTRDSILSRIKELIDGEDPEHPLSDQKITDILATEGTEISRRAVAKYRDEAGILSTSQRRKRF